MAQPARKNAPAKFKTIGWIKRETIDAMRRRYRMLTEQQVAPPDAAPREGLYRAAGLVIWGGLR